MRSLFVFATNFFLLTYSMAQEAAVPAEAAKAAPNSLLMNLPMIVLFVALFYFLIIAPQRKQQKIQQDFQKSLSRGDEVVTASGIIGKVAGLTDRVVTLEVAPGTEIRVLRSQIQAKLKELAVT
jgi:preprotein translocase subunit YajC